jgi:hypothetical protein
MTAVQDRPYFAALIFSAIFALIVGMFLGAIGARWDQPAPAGQVDQVAPGWRSGELPLDAPVVGLWLYEGELVTMPVVQTEFAGILEYALVRRYARSMPRPDFWAPLPEVNP